MTAFTDAELAGLNFTAIDFETANGFRGSPCSVGLVRVRDGQVADTAYWLMRPPAGFDRFDPRNVRIHGITDADVLNAPRFGDLFADMNSFIDDDVLVAHNAGFDLGVIESALEVSNAEIPSFRYGCSLMLARKSYALASYALPSASAEAGYVLDQHHDALADSHACAAIVVDIARRGRIESLSARPEPSVPVSMQHVLGTVGLGLRQLRGRPVGASESKATVQARGMAEFFDATVDLPGDTELPDLMRWPDEGRNPEPRADAEPNHPLYGQHVVFTGNLGMARQEAKNRAGHHGAYTANRISAQTTMVVVGDGFRPEHLDEQPRSRTVGHRKMRDALARQKKGQQISIVAEPEFLQMLDANWPAATQI